MKVCAMYSGGKDSTYAIHWAFLKGMNVLCTITILPEREDSWMFQAINVQFSKYPAEAMGIYDHVFIRSSGEKDKELESLKKAFTIAKEKGVDGIVTGALRSDYQRMNILLIAEEVGLKVFSPLWRKNQEEYLRNLIDIGFKFIITSASAYGFPFDLVGKIIERHDIERIIDAARKYGFNPAFEGGEAETFVIYAPLFKRELKVKGKVINRGEFERQFIIEHIL
jgi:ABC transporter with metal-binding/Fe-S-binding domain ATP-binding protein